MPRRPTGARARREAHLARIAATDAVSKPGRISIRVHCARRRALRRGRTRPTAARSHGIGVGVKDIIATASMPTEMGSPIYAGHHPPLDAECVARLSRAGGYVFGKTVTTEFAYFHPGKTANPWNPRHTPGGSSSGSAAAVAAGQVLGAIGTQTNGSVIRPAAYCGVVGFKPTKDTIPLDGVHVFSATLDQIGTFARDVAGAALLASALADPGRIAATVQPLRAAAAPRLPCRLSVDDDRPRRCATCWTPPSTRCAQRRGRREASNCRRAGATPISCTARS